MKRLNQSGYNLVELIIAVGILATLASTVMVARTFMAKQTVRTNDKAYATQKAIQMFEELKALVNGGEKQGVNVLDQYSDGSAFNNVLTTDKNVDVFPVANAKPDDPLSGNKNSNGHWRYLRQVQVNRVANDPFARQVIIKVWLFASDANPGQPGELLAEVGGVLRTLTSVFPPTQVMDIYVLAVNNIAAWWAAEPVLYQTFKSICDDIQGRNPGLELRPHFITRSSYGRDSQYIPYINSASAADSGVLGGIIPKVYFYPGLVPQDAPSNGCGCEADFYDPSPFGVQVTGNFNVDGTTNYTSGQFSGCPNYSVADQYNNSMRYPDELVMYGAVTAAAVTANPALPLADSVTEISERMLIEGMLSSPQSFRNAMIVNLHGELVPLPPMRNYSDPAKDPMNSPNVRVVTHPESIFYPTAAGTTGVTLRVYAYYDGMDDMTQLNNAGGHPDIGQSVADTSVFLPDVNLTAAQVSAVAIVGSGFLPLKYAPVTLTSGAAATMGMSYVVTNPNGGTLIDLSGTPLRCTLNPGKGGLKETGVPTNLLYNMEYIPCSPERTAYGTPFTAQDLTDTNDNDVKNTARWEIILNNFPVTSVVGGNTFIGQHAIETRIGANNIASGFPNVSRTYVWVGNNNLPPATEQYQFMGDPRHCPYLDVKVGGPAGGGVSILANGYNWFFKQLNGNPTDGYRGFGGTGNAVNVAGWGGDNNNVDIPRFYQAIRNGLLNATAIWTTMNGWTYYYFGFGGEMGSDQPPYSKGITINQTPWNTTATTSLTTVTEMISGTGAVTQLRVASSTNNNWYAKTWLGELYPDSAYATWNATGNLPVAVAAPGPAHFYRRSLSAVPNPGANSLNGFGRDTNNRTGSNGSTGFYNGTAVAADGGGQMNHQGSNGTDTIASLAVSCYNIFQYPLAQAIASGNLRPWHLSDAQVTTEWNWPPYNTHTTLSIPNVGGNKRIFYTSDAGSDWKGSAVVQITDSSGNVAYVTESGLAISANVGTGELGKTALVELLRTFLDGGNYAGIGHIVQIPIIKTYVDSPNYQYYQPNNIFIVIDGPVTTGVPLIIGGVTIQSGPTTNMWYRYPGVTSSMANVYTEEYPNYPNLATSSYGETIAGQPMTLDFNLKYSSNGGKSWSFMQDNANAQTGILDTSATHLISSNSLPVTYQWAVPAGLFPQGDYWIRAEAYRRSLPLDYAYHKLDISINR